MTNHQKKSYFLLGVLTTGCLLICIIAGKILEEEPMLRFGSPMILLRYDDYQIYDTKGYNNEITQWEKEKDFLDFLVEHQVKASVGIIPFIKSTVQGKKEQGTLSNERISQIRKGLKKNLFELCLHGYTHSSNFLSDTSEFSGIPRETQIRWMESGKNHLKEIFGIDPVVFIPPWNAWDDNTIAAMVETHMVTLSADAFKYPTDNSIHYYPYTVTPNELYYLLENNKLDTSNIIVINIHPFDLVENTDKLGLEKMEIIIKKLLKLNPYVYFISYDDAIKTISNETQKHMDKYYKLNNWVQFWKKLPFSRIYIKTKSLSAYRPRYNEKSLNLLRGLLGIVILFIGVVLGIVVIKTISVRYHWVYVTASVVLLVLVSAKTIEKLNIGMFISARRFCIVSFLLGNLCSVFYLIWRIYFSKRTCKWADAPTS